MSKLLNRLDREISFHREKNMDNYALFFEQIKAELIKAQYCKCTTTDRDSHKKLNQFKRCN